MRESGYFLPHVPIGYAFTVLASLGSWPILQYVFGIHNAALLLSIMVAVAVLFGIWFVRHVDHGTGLFRRRLYISRRMRCHSAGW